MRKYLEKNNNLEVENVVVDLNELDEFAVEDVQIVGWTMEER